MRFNLYGLFIALGVAAAVFYMRLEARRRSLPDELAVDVALWAVPLAVVFSRIYYVIFTWERYRDDWLSVFRVWEGGLAIYGGVIGGALGVFLLSRRRKFPYPLLADLVAPGLLLGQAIGRWGNFFNAEAYGLVVSNPAFRFFPIAVFADGNWHLATFLYESLWNLLGFLFLLKMRKPSQARGNGWLFAWYLVFYGLGRMVIEGLRTDSLMLGGLRVSQALSVLLIGLSGLLMVIHLKLSRRLLLPLPAALACFALAAAGRSAFLPVAYALMAAFAGFLLAAFLRSRAGGEA